MDIAALVLWLITALGGFYMLGIWLSHGGARGRGSHLPVPLVFGHFTLAVIGLVIWIIYVATNEDAFAWTAFILLIPVALLGFTMFARWLPVQRQRVTAPPPATPAERHFPVPVVAVHGVSAVATVALVLLSALGIGD